MGETDLAGRLGELQKVSAHVMMRKRLRWSAVGSMVFGGIAVYLGATGLKEHPLNVILLLLGAFLLIEGLWLLAAPSPRCLIADGLAFLALGAWNLFITVLNVAAGGEPGGFFAVVGIFQIGWGIQSFRRYARFGGSTEKPNEEILKKVGELVDGVKKANARKAEDIIEFQTKGFIRQEAWKARLAGDVGMFIALIGDEAIFARREEVTIASKGKVLIGKSLKASFQIGKTSLKGTIPPESMQRYEAWKAAESTEGES